MDEPRITPPQRHKLITALEAVRKYDGVYGLKDGKIDLEEAKHVIKKTNIFPNVRKCLGEDGFFSLRDLLKDEDLNFFLTLTPEEFRKLVDPKYEDVFVAFQTVFSRGMKFQDPKAVPPQDPKVTPPSIGAPKTPQETQGISRAKLTLVEYRDSGLEHHIDGKDDKGKPVYLRGGDGRVGFSKVYCSKRENTAYSDGKKNFIIFIGEDGYVHTLIDDSGQKKEVIVQLSRIQSDFKSGSFKDIGAVLKDGKMLRLGKEKKSDQGITIMLFSSNEHKLFAINRSGYTQSIYTPPENSNLQNHLGRNILFLSESEDKSDKKLNLAEGGEETQSLELPDGREEFVKYFYAMYLKDYMEMGDVTKLEAVGAKYRSSPTSFQDLSGKLYLAMSASSVVTVSKEDKGYLDDLDKSLFPKGICSERCPIETVGSKTTMEDGTAGMKLIYDEDEGEFYLIFDCVKAEKGKKKKEIMVCKFKADKLKEALSAKDINWDKLNQDEIKKIANILGQYRFFDDSDAAIPLSVDGKKQIEEIPGIISISMSGDNIKSIVEELKTKWTGKLKNIISTEPLESLKNKYSVEFDKLFEGGKELTYQEFHERYVDEIQIYVRKKNDPKGDKFTDQITVSGLFNHDENYKMLRELIDVGDKNGKGKNDGKISKEEFEAFLERYREVRTLETFKPIQILKLILDIDDIPPNLLLWENTEKELNSNLAKQVSAMTQSKAIGFTGKTSEVTRFSIALGGQKEYFMICSQTKMYYYKGKEVLEKESDVFTIVRWSSNEEPIYFTIPKDVVRKFIGTSERPIETNDKITPAQIRDFAIKKHNSSVLHDEITEKLNIRPYSITGIAESRVSILSSIIRKVNENNKVDENNIAGDLAIQIKTQKEVKK